MKYLGFVVFSRLPFSKDSRSALSTVTKELFSGDDRRIFPFISLSLDLDFEQALS